MLRVAFTPDGKRLVSTHDKGTICVFRVSPEWAEARPAYQPLDPAWRDRVRALPPAEQVREVSAEMVRRNPGFDGVLDPHESSGRIKSVSLITNQVEDIRPLQGFPLLERVVAGGRDVQGKLWDLSPLAGMQLTELKCQSNPVWDVSPLKGMPLTTLFLDQTAVADLSPLAGMKLNYLCLTMCPVRDLTPLAGMDFKTELFLHNCGGVTDLGPLRTAHVRNLTLPPVFRGDLAPLTATGIEGLNIIDPAWRPTPEQRRALEAIPTLRFICGKPAADYWRDLDAGPKKE